MIHFRLTIKYIFTSYCNLILAKLLRFDKKMIFFYKIALHYFTLML